MHKTPSGSFNMGKGNGFLVVKRKGLMDEDEVWADGTLKVATLKQPTAALGKGHARTGRNVSSFHKAPTIDVQTDKWSPPCYFDISVGGLGHSWRYDSVEGILLLETDEAVEAFREGPTTLDAIMRSAHSHIKGYGVTKDTTVDLDVAGALIRINVEANTRTYAHRVDPEQLLDGHVRAPHEFAALYRMLSSMSASTQSTSSVLSNIENRGSTLLYRMPMWVYES
eukprot:jgi/Botrbrau1/1478/Bobra.178_3s0034.1